MAMIFDRFPTPTAAARFRAAVERDYELETAAFDNVADSHEADPFPYKLTPPIVHVERTDDAEEELIEELVETYGGRFAGT